MHNHQSKGFTLIELLVVIAIISVLSTITVVAINPAQRMAEARDAQRKLNLAQIAEALETYLVMHGDYPCEGTPEPRDGSNSCSGDWCTNSHIYRDLVGGGYLKYLPRDPVNNSTYYYWYEPHCSGQHGCPTGPGGWCGDGKCCEFWVRARLEATGSLYYVRSY